MIKPLRCTGCNVLAEDLLCYRFANMDDAGHKIYETESEYVRQEEGTYNRENEHFLCDECYIKAGQPSSPSGWKCP